MDGRTDGRTDKPRPKPPSAGNKDYLCKNYNFSQISKVALVPNAKILQLFHVLIKITLTLDSALTLYIMIS